MAMNPSSQFSIKILFTVNRVKGVINEKMILGQD